jgi:hypothetical protein
MKLKLTFSYFILLIVCVFLSSIVMAEQQKFSENIVGVNQFMKNPDKYSGEISVKGVVSHVFSQQKLVALIDVEELRACKVVTCARLTLPVRWEGSMPEIKSIVKVNGKLSKEGERLVFSAKSLKKIE